MQVKMSENGETFYLKYTSVDEIIGDARTKDCIVGGF